MSTKKNDNAYLPEDRTDYHPEDIKSGNTTLPNPAEDPIVVNNIATSEFDYTENLETEQDY